MNHYLELFIAGFIYIAVLDYPTYTKGINQYGSSKHFGACRTPRMSKRSR